MTNKLHIRDKQADTSKGEPAILERLSVDAHEIVKNDPERYEIVGRVPSSVSNTGAVLDNDPPHVVARKVLKAAGVEPEVPEDVSTEVADEDSHGVATPEAEAKKAEAKTAKGRGAKKPAKPVKTEEVSDEETENEG